MVAYVFDTILQRGVAAGEVPARTRAARDWFRETAAGYSSNNPVPPKYEFHEGLGKQRLEEDIKNLLEWRTNNEE